MNQINYSNDDFTFLGFIIDITTNINFETSFSDAYIEYEGGPKNMNAHKLTGTKYIEITPYSTVESDWNLQIKKHQYLLFFNLQLTHILMLLIIISQPTFVLEVRHLF